MKTPKSIESKNAQKWHAFEVDDVLMMVNSSADGLTKNEASNRLARYGLNQLPEQKRKGFLLRFAQQIHNVLIYVLIVAGGITLFLGHMLDAGVIFGVVLINAFIGFIQEGKAENALKAIRQMLSQSAMVKRDGASLKVPANELVLGDVVLLEAGDKVPADLRIMRCKGLQVQESALTGESIAVDKQVAPVHEQSVLGDRLSIAFSGTLITHGQGVGVVVATGADTELGNISKLVANVDNVSTPLLRQMAQFGAWLTMGILALAAITFAFGVFLRGYAVTDMFLAAVSLAVAAIPEGLPAIMTITLAIGVQRMAGRHAIIRKLPAVETLGAVSVICSDKTGTLTRNEMTVRQVCTAADTVLLTGTGYDPHGLIKVNGKEVNPDELPSFMKVCHSAVLCNDATLQQHNESWDVQGDPMEGALLVAGLKCGLDIKAENSHFPRLDFIPFEAEHRFMATLHHSHEGETFVYVKGAPERLIAMCSHQQTNDGDSSVDRDYWLACIENMASQGQRVLAFAVKKLPSEQVELTFSDVENGLTMLGMFGMIDPPRDEVVGAIESCKRAHIRVKMITGDHGLTAKAIAKQLGLVNAASVLTGADIEAMTDEELQSKVLEVDVYARVNPEHKLRLVKLLQKKNLIVAMTGDGVNDAPALKRADVGTAMGRNGTEAAKEAAEMVLADDNFTSITHAVEEGRTVYDNLKKAILFILPTNGGEALIVLGAVILGFQALPLTPIHILWVNMVTAVTLALALAFEPPEHNVMERPPRDASQPMLTTHLVWRIAFVSVILMAGTFGLFVWEMSRGIAIEHGRTIAVNTLVMFEIFYLINSRYIINSSCNWRGICGNRYVVYAICGLLVIQMMFTYLPPMQHLFGTTNLSAIEWGRIILIASSVFMLVEIEKFFVRRHQK